METVRENKGNKQPIKMRFKLLADGRQSIYLDHSENGKHHYEFLKLYLLPETNKENVKQNKATMKEANAVLKERVTALFEKKGKEQTFVSSKMLISDWMDMYYDIQKNRGAKYLNYIHSLKNMLARFDSSARLCDVTKDFYLRYIDFIRNDYVTKEGNPLKPKTARDYVANFSVSISFAVAEGLLLDNPYNRIPTVQRIRVPRNMREYLTIDEVKKLIDTPVRKQNKRVTVKRAFLFSCFCGLRISDVKALKWKNIVENQGQTYLSIIMRKTEAPIYLPLSKQAMKWLPEQSDRDPESVVFQGMKADLQTNEYISDWVKDAGIAKHITFHCARHTCATMLLTLGADIYTVSKILGHRRLKETQIYTKIIDSKKDAAVSLADNVF